MRAAAIVVNHNGGADLECCLAALGAQSPAVEVVLVDCASSDGSRRLAEAPPAGVRGLPLTANLGYAGGCRAGLAALSAAVEVIGFFNPDCFPAPDYFARCLERLAGDERAGGVAGRLIRPGGALLDSCGQVLTPALLRVRDRGYGQPAAGAFPNPAPVLAACGAAMVYRRAALEAAAVEGEVFPAEFFAFWEDLDLGWRVSNAGWRVVYEPAAVAVHRRGATAAPGRGPLTLRRSPRLAACILVNRWATLLRNLHRVDFLHRLPLLLSADMAMVALLVLHRPAVLPELLRETGRLRLAWRQRHALAQRRLARLP
ncbi:MAG: glycosyltransferase family 2 protein [Acidobacteriota bacterium]